MKRVLISTVYNESPSIERWVDALKAQTVQPDEFVIVDGASRDDTVELLRKGFAKGNFPRPRIIVQRCNIAEGRNLAIQNSTQDIIASTDAGSLPDPRWLQEITSPFEEHSGIGVVGGSSSKADETSLQKAVSRIDSSSKKNPPVGSSCSPSSRNVAFTRQAWATVGGYPEWLTLTAEDALYNANLHAAGIRFYYQPSATVTWEMRSNLADYLKMLKNYGYGSAEMGQTPYLYRRFLMTTLLPPLILISPHPLSYAPLRYLRNAASAWGWIKGNLVGRRPPKDWRRVDGVWLSPQTLAAIRDRRPDQA